jgi:3-hydroxyisobutyrate dehydrogenase-like beta-hydroxyacid dehydrogenase
MGGNMAARFLAAGYSVHGSSRSSERAQWLVDQGLRWCDTPREVAEAVDVVFTSVPDDEVVESVASGHDGILAGLGAGALWVDVSTIDPRTSRGLAARVRERGAQMLDAPVSGSVPQVKAGTLRIIVGGDADAYARVEPILRVLGSPTRVGDNGQGLALKLAINISLAVQMLAFSEGLLLAAHDGIDPHLAAEVMTKSAIGSPMLIGRVPLVLDRTDQAWFDVATARDLRVPLPSAGVADLVLGRAAELGYEHRDIAALYEVLERMADEPLPEPSAERVERAAR